MGSLNTEFTLLDSLFIKLITFLTFLLTILVTISVIFSKIADPIPQTLIVFGYGISLASLFILLVTNPPLNVWLKFPNRSHYPYLLILGSMLFYGAIFVILGLFSGTLQPSHIILIDRGFYFYTFLWIVIALLFFISYVILEQEIPYYLKILEQMEEH